MRDCYPKLAQLYSVIHPLVCKSEENHSPDSDIWELKRYMVNYRKTKTTTIIKIAIIGERTQIILDLEAFWFTCFILHRNLKFLKVCC